MSPSALFFRGECSAGGLGSKLKYHVQKLKETREYKMSSPKSSINLSCSRAVCTSCTNFKPQCTKRYVPANDGGN